MTKAQKPYTARQRALIAKWADLPYWVINKWFREVRGLELECAESAAVDALCYAATKYDPKRIAARTGRPCQFNTLATLAIRQRVYRALLQLRAGRNRFPCVSLSAAGLREQFLRVPDRNRPPRRVEPEVRAALVVALDSLPERERYIVIRSTLEEDLSLATLGRELGIHKERVRQLKVRALGQLREVLPQLLEDFRSDFES